MDYECEMCGVGLDEDEIVEFEGYVFCSSGCRCDFEREREEDNDPLQ